NKEDQESVSKQLQTLTRLCRDHGSAIGIAHPKAGSLAALRQFARKIPPDIRLTAVHRLLL
ncbi:MAG: divergent polysaccharide deacetylase family protein, partial [Deltaproteobacteria bacterium]